jgi:hypothetical protein
MLEMIKDCRLSTTSFCNNANLNSDPGKLNELRYIEIASLLPKPQKKRKKDKEKRQNVLHSDDYTTLYGK